MTAPSSPPQYPPVVEELLARVTKLEEVVATLIGHQHAVNPVWPPDPATTTRPIGMSGTKLR